MCRREPAVASATRTRPSREKRGCTVPFGCIAIDPVALEVPVLWVIELSRGEPFFGAGARRRRYGARGRHPRERGVCCSRGVVIESRWAERAVAGSYSSADARGVFPTPSKPPAMSNPQAFIKERGGMAAPMGWH